MKIVPLIALFILPFSVFATTPDDEGWINLFNGENLDGWVVKVTGYEAGENPGDMFRVEDGVMSVDYDAHDTFVGQFGHIYTETSYSNYRFRCEYRFIGEQLPNAPKWAFCNSGIMFHSQAADTLDFDQKFPDSLEFQFLGESEEDDFRPSGSLFLVGNAADYMVEEVLKNVKTEFQAVPLGEWVEAELVVNDALVQFYLNGELVLEFTNPRERDGTPLTSGHIALQAESHPVQFRNIAIKPMVDVATAQHKWADGWQPLFNGIDLSDFEVEDGKATYEVNDGVITGHTAVPSPNTFLSTKKAYGDFELVFETKVHDNLNSGVQIRSRSRAEKEGKFKVGRYYGPQVEIEASPGQSGFIYGEATGRGWLSPEPQSDDPAINQHEYLLNGEWNHYRIVAKGARIQTYINGRLVADLADEQIYESHPKGHIGLQVHSIKKELHPMSVSWRNLYIRELR
jgi:hypothetical protein